MSGSSWLPDGLRRVFRIGLAGGDADREVDRELAFHFERTVEELEAAGAFDTARAVVLPVPHGHASVILSCAIAMSVARDVRVDFL